MSNKNNVLVFAEIPFASMSELAEYLDDMPNVRLDKLTNNADGTVSAKLDAFICDQDALDIAFAVDSGAVINARKYAYNRKTFKKNPNGSVLETNTTWNVKKTRN